MPSMEERKLAVNEWGTYTYRFAAKPFGVQISLKTWVVRVPAWQPLNCGQYRVKLLLCVSECVKTKTQWIC